MIIGIGIDIVEISRFERELAKGAWSRHDGVFSQEEIATCSQSRNPAQRYAECFAAKEAVLKALGLNVSDMAIFREAEVQLRRPHGYALFLHGRVKTGFEKAGARNIQVSIGHTARHTIAMVIVER